MLSEVRTEFLLDRLTLWGATCQGICVLSMNTLAIAWRDWEPLGLKTLPMQHENTEQLELNS